MNNIKRVIITVEGRGVLACTILDFLLFAARKAGAQRGRTCGVPAGTGRKLYTENESIIAPLIVVSAASSCQTGSNDWARDFKIANGPTRVAHSREARFLARSSRDPL